jgi:hypothetical protein
MTRIEDFQKSVWAEIPAFRRAILGRERVNDLVSIAVEQCPLDLCGHVTRGTNGCEVLMAAWGQNVKRAYSLVYAGDEYRFGPLFWILISPVMTFIMEKILDWFFSSKSRRNTLAKWKRELTT